MLLFDKARKAPAAVSSQGVAIVFSSPKPFDKTAWPISGNKINPSEAINKGTFKSCRQDEKECQILSKKLRRLSMAGLCGTILD